MWCKISIWPKSWNIIKYKNLLSHRKMSKKLLTFGDIEIEKNTFHSYKTLMLLQYVDIEEVLYLKRFL